MKIHNIRNATLVVEIADSFILVDPMLGGKGSQLPFSLFRFKVKRNPIVSLSDNAEDILDKVTHCLITHKHPDHIDSAGIKFLSERNIPIICSEKDSSHFNKKGLNVSQALDYWKEDDFLNGKIIGIPAKHGYGFISSLMGNVMGFCVKLEQGSFYISGDTIYTDDVEKALIELKPDVCVVAGGRAQLDLGKPLMMNIEDVIKFTEKAPKKVLINHLEALNHCPVTRDELKNILQQKGFLEKTSIPRDGETITYK